MILTAVQTHRAMLDDEEWWEIPFMEFVDDLRHHRDPTLVAEAIKRSGHRFDQLMASTVEYLCHELDLDEPEWTCWVESLREPWFVSGVESLKAITQVESPAEFRMRMVFVLENFLSRA